jgi:hypothetical protein
MPRLPTSDGADGGDDATGGDQFGDQFGACTPLSSVINEHGGIMGFSGPGSHNNGTMNCAGAVTNAE